MIRSDDWFIRDAAIESERSIRNLVFSEMGVETNTGFSTGGWSEKTGSVLNQSWPKVRRPKLGRGMTATGSTVLREWPTIGSPDRSGRTTSSGQPRSGDDLGWVITALLHRPFVCPTTVVATATTGNIRARCRYSTFKLPCEVTENFVCFQIKPKSMSLVADCKTFSSKPPGRTPSRAQLFARTERRRSTCPDLHSLSSRKARRSECDVWR